MRAFTGLVDTNYILDAIRGSESLEVQVRLNTTTFAWYLIYPLFWLTRYWVRTWILLYVLNLMYCMPCREIMSEDVMIGQNGYFIKPTSKSGYFFYQNVTIICTNLSLRWKYWLHYLAGADGKMQLAAICLRTEHVGWFDLGRWLW